MMFEHFLTKIRIATFNCRSAGDNPAQRFRPPPLRFGKQNRKIFSTFFLIACPQIFFQFTPLNKIFDFNLRSKLFNGVKETKIFLFCLSADAEIAETPPPHSPPSAGRQAGKNSFSPHPFFFLPACWKPPVIFSDGGGTSNWAVGGVSFNNFSTATHQFFDNHYHY